MTKKRCVGIVFGGKNVEHEISVRSAVNIINALDKELFDYVAIGIDKEGEWHFVDFEKLKKIYSHNNYISLSDYKDVFTSPVDFSFLKRRVDTIFPVLHGRIGEDGCVQGLFTTLDIPFVGSDVLSSSICMDKEVTKRLLDFEGIRVTPYLIYTSLEEVCYQEVIDSLGCPVFIKPSNSGSSVGVFKAKTLEQLKRYVTKSFEFDHKILIEKSVDGLEIECAVIGNDYPKASMPARVISSHEYYSYEAKYIDPQGASFENPACISEENRLKIQEIAIKAYKVLRCSGMARVDFFISEDNKIYVNEINTIPGFTNISMYPKMWECSGLSYQDLISELIDLSLEKKKKDQRLLNNVVMATEEKLFC